MTFPAYPDYKDSGIEWLGKVPKHWDVMGIKWLSAVQRGASPRPIDDPKYFDDGGEYAWVRISDVSSSNGVLRETTQRLSDLGSSLSVKLTPNTLFISIAGTVGKPCITEIYACIHDGFVYFPNLKLNPKWLFRIFESGLCYAGLGKMGTQLNLNTDTIGSIRVPVPTSIEIENILLFLDNETAKIDALIAEQEKLIALLTEKRQSVISNAVCRGLDPNVPMKDSGVEWMGMVPEHWQWGTLSRIADRVVVGIAEAATHAYADSGTPILRATNIRPGRIIGDILHLTQEYSEDRDTKMLKAGDLVTVRTGNAGVTAVIPDEFDNCHCFTMLITTLKSYSIPEYYCYWANSIASQQYFSLEGWGTAQVNISVPILKSLPVPIPSPQEQLEIVRHLDEELGCIDALIDTSKSGIVLLIERRSALITATVTGQIDVRNHQ